MSNEKNKNKDREKQVDSFTEKTIAMFESYRAAKSDTTKKWKQIRSLYNGTFWELFKSKVKEHTLIPDTNYIEYVVNAFINSIYSGSYIPEAEAIKSEAQEYIPFLNAFIEYTWKKNGMKKRYTEWGENVTLYNMQPVKIYVGDGKFSMNDKEGNRIEKQISEVKMETISPFAIFLDPSVNDFKEGQAIFIAKNVNIHTLKQDKRYKDKITTYLSGRDKNLVVMNPQDGTKQVVGNRTISTVEFYIKEDGGIVEGMIVDNKELIYKKKLSVNEFPLEILYQRKPNEGPYGTPLVAKILNSYIALNLLDSMDATQPYLAMNRPKFFDIRSRINPRAFKNYGNTPGATFGMFGDPAKGIYYQDIQFIQDTSQIKQRLESGIFHVTGVDPAYKGRQTNSIITTGGVEAQQARVTMMTDNAPLVALESFVEDLATQFLNYNIHLNEKIDIDMGGYVDKDGRKTFKDLKNIDFKFLLESKPYVPMTKETLFEVMVRLYEMQGQYNFQIPLIMEEDLIDEMPLPAVKKERFLQRFTKEKANTSAIKRRETLLTFAALFQELQQNGLGAEEAAEEALNIMDEEAMAMQENPSLGVNPQAMPPSGGMPGGF